MNCDVCEHQTTCPSRCDSCRVKVRRYRLKAALVAMLGGSCARCGFDGDMAALDFHHLRDKEFTIAGGMTSKAWDVLKAEARKCELICANCHRIEHSDYDNPNLIAAAERPRWVRK